MDLTGSCSNLAPALKSLVSAVPAIRGRQPWGAGVRVCTDTRGELAAESSRAIGLLDARLRQQAARRYEAGATLRQIAKEIGVGRERLGAALRADGVATRRQAVPRELVPSAAAPVEWILLALALAGVLFAARLWRDRHRSVSLPEPADG